MSTSDGKISIRIRHGATETRIEAERGATLRDVLLQHRLSPYRGRSRRLNCKGLGVCGTCQVEVQEEGVTWLRRSCQIRCFHDLEIALQ